VKVRTEEPEPGIASAEGLTVTVTPAGRSETDKLIVDEKPPKTVEWRVTDPLPPCTRVTVAGEAAIVNPGALILYVAAAVPENAGAFQFVTDAEMLYAPSAVPAGDVTCKVVEPLAPAAKAKPVTPVVAVQPAGADSVNSN
jgi:hypothetical protein